LGNEKEAVLNKLLFVKLGTFFIRLEQKDQADYGKQNNQWPEKPDYQFEADVSDNHESNGQAGCGNSRCQPTGTAGAAFFDAKQKKNENYTENQPVHFLPHRQRPLRQPS
jgi:hypothetical protein